MIKELIQAFMMVFVAEMGDKTQIIAMTFATQYLVREVLAGVALGVIFNHGMAILLGRYLSSVVPMNVIQIVAGFVFIIFGLLTLNDEDDDGFENKKELSPIITVGLAFFIGELGDKTQLTAMALAAEAVYPLFILMGTTLGMIATSGLGIFVGSRIGDKIPETTIKIGSSIIFLFFGVTKLYTVLPKKYLTTLNIIVFLIALIAIEVILIRRYLRSVKGREGKTAYKRVASDLYEQTKRIELSLEDVCLGSNICGKCMGSDCLVGYIKFLLKDARENGIYYKKTVLAIDGLANKNYDPENVEDALSLILLDYSENEGDYNEDFVIDKIRKSLEYILFGVYIEEIINIDDYFNKLDELNLEKSRELRNKLNLKLEES